MFEWGQWSEWGPWTAGCQNQKFQTKCGFGSQRFRERERRPVSFKKSTKKPEIRDFVTIRTVNPFLFSSSPPKVKDVITPYRALRV